MTENQTKQKIQTIQSAAAAAHLGIKVENQKLRQRVAELEATAERIQHFATGSCDMDATTRLKCIAKECEAAKAAGGEA